MFATYFTTHIAASPIVGTNQWGNAIALSGLIIAFLSPILGAVAEHNGNRKYWLAFFTLIMIASAGMLWFAYPNVSYTHFTLIAVVLGSVSMNLCMVFYNALLPYITTPEYVGRVSGWGWGLGYLGGLIVLFIALSEFVYSPPTWISTENFAQIRICGPLTALWMIVFALPIFIYVSDYKSKSLNMQKAVRVGLLDLWHTLLNMPQEKNILLFLMTQMIYIDGLNTLFAFGGIYAAGTFHMNMRDVLMLGITMNACAGIGSIILATVNDKYGAKFTILLCLFSLMFFGVLCVLVQTVRSFWIAGSFLSLFVGAIQSSSRTLMIQIIPPNKTTEMFGLYALSGKISMFIGPWILGIVTLYFDSQRIGMAAILGFFIIGATLMCFVRETRTENAAILKVT